MVLQRKSHVLFHSAIVKGGVLEEKPHLLSDFSQLVEREASNILPRLNRSGVWFLQADNDSEQNALTCSASPQHGQGFTAAYSEA